MNLDMLALAYLIAIISPGPSLFMILRNSLSQVSNAGFFTALGTVMGISCQSIYMLCFLTVIDKQSVIFLLLKSCSSCYLIFLGIKGLFHKTQSIHFCNKSIKTRFIAFKQGFCVDFLNPLALSFFLGLFSVYIPQNATIQEKTLVWFIITIIGGIWFMGISIVINNKKIMWVIEKTNKKYLEIMISVVLIYMGIKLCLQ